MVIIGQIHARGFPLRTFDQGRHVQKFIADIWYVDPLIKQFSTGPFKSLPRFCPPGPACVNETLI